MHLYEKGFRQKHHAMCGPASIILATQSLGLDAKEESEWTSQKYSAWMPVDDFLVRGMALHELQCTSELIYGEQIEILLRRAFPENYSLFLDDIEAYNQLQTSVIVINYRQDDFVSTNPDCQQGNPHYSLIIDWNSSKKEILIADVDFGIKKQYWVNIEAMFQSMNHCNPAIGIPRGWLVLRKRSA